LHCNHDSEESPELASFAFFESCIALRSLVFHMCTNRAMQAANEIRFWMTRLCDTTLLPNLELLILAGSESEQWNHGCFPWCEGPREDMIIAQDVFLELCRARPQLHLFVRLFATEFDSHRYEESPIVRSQAGERGKICWKPFLLRDVPPSGAAQFYWSPLMLAG
jgi:hypothetical protein